MRSPSPFANGAGIPWIPALILAGLVTVPIGAVLAIPAIRASGLYLALATFGFGLVLQDMFYNTNVMFGSIGLGIQMPKPSLSWLDVGSSTGFYYVVLAIAVISAAVIIALTRTRLGRLLQGLGDSPVALATNGANVTTLRISVFCISAFLAAVAGVLAGMAVTVGTPDSYPPLLSLTYVVLVVIVVGSEPWYTLIAAAGLILFPAYVQGSNVTLYLQVLFGLSAILVVVAPPGALGTPEYVKRLADKIGGRRTKATRTWPTVNGTATAEPDSEPTAGLVVEHLTVRFGGLVAVNNVSLAAPLGRVTGLIGPNGAGKSTTFNACCGLARANATGDVELDSQNVAKLAPALRARMGLGRTFQQPELFESLTVRENVTIGQGDLAGRNAVSPIVGFRGERAMIESRTSKAGDRVVRVDQIRMKMSPLCPRVSAVWSNWRVVCPARTTCSYSMSRPLV